MYAIFNPASLVLIFILPIVAILSHSFWQFYKFVLYCFLIFAIYINSGYFLKLGAWEMTYSQFLLIFVLFNGFILLKHLKIRRTFVFLFLSLLFSIIMADFFLFIIPPNFQIMPITGGSWDLQYLGINQMVSPHLSIQNIEKFLMIVIFFTFYLQLEKFLYVEKSVATKLRNFIVFTSIANAFLGIFELLSSYIFHTDIVLRFVQKFFGIVESQSLIPFTKIGTIALQGFTKEPSQYALSFLPAIFMLPTMGTSKYRFNKYFTLLLFAWALVFSGSLTGFIICALGIVIFFIKNGDKLYQKILFAIFIAIAFLLVFQGTPLIKYYINRANAAIMGTGFIGSEGIRLFSIKKNIEWFLARPFLGLGFGTTNSYGFIPALLANMGIIGAVLWFILMIKGNIPTKFQNLPIFLIFMICLAFMSDIGYSYSPSLLLIVLLFFRKNEKHFQDSV